MINTHGEDYEVQREVLHGMLDSVLESLKEITTPAITNKEDRSHAVLVNDYLFKVRELLLDLGINAEKLEW
jgi:hypothetical protein